MIVLGTAQGVVIVRDARTAERPLVGPSVAGEDVRLVRHQIAAVALGEGASGSCGLLVSHVGTPDSNTARRCPGHPACQQGRRTG